MARSKSFNIDLGVFIVFLSLVFAIWKLDITGITTFGIGLFLTLAMSFLLKLVLVRGRYGFSNFLIKTKPSKHA